MQVELSIHVCQPSSEGPLDAEAEGEEASSSYCEWELPAAAFCGLWESLIYNQVPLLLQAPIQDVNSRSPGHRNVGKFNDNRHGTGEQGWTS